ncbi:hypothetical protein [Hymenobacter rubripertinctus]|uniref:Uncharacterized protein n=1 Tax=Hymenobacter rubripertinctus TaxID=2029981 RepID=A0A418QTY6_9BACT|nr:hypothetical protein [Hymenobacter rubripertinctus]RIY08624.1 hypothetical protein D0T11_14010 [Hymenobacter rubripertinctus]
MKILLTLLLALLLTLPGATLAQAPAGVPTLNFCGVDLPVENGCSPTSSTEIACANYRLSWAYLDYRAMTAYPPEYIRQAKKEHKGTETQPFTCSLLNGPPAQGVRLAYATDNGMAYRYIVCAAAKGQPVLLDLTLSLDPEKTDDLPAVVQQIMRLER